MTAAVTDQDRIHAVARALLDVDGHEPTRPRPGAELTPFSPSVPYNPASPSGLTV